MDETRVLVITTAEIHRLIAREMTPWIASALPSVYCFQPRTAVEEDEQWLQIIPYVVLRHKQGQVWAYARRGGDGRLLNRFSIGVGGHIEESDQQATLLETVLHCAKRELAEELADVENVQIDPQPLGWIHERETAIGRVHLGLVFVADWQNADPPVPKPNEPMTAIGFLSIDTVLADDRFERWSHLAVASLMANGKLAAADSIDWPLL